jgi:hypothetical protein
MLGCWATGVGVCLSALALDEVEGWAGTAARRIGAFGASFLPDLSGP